MQQFQAEVNIRKFMIFWSWFVFIRVGSWLWCRWVNQNNAVMNVKILAAEVHKLLFGHAKVGSIYIKLVIHLYLCVFLDDVTESKDKLLLVVLALEIVHVMWFGIMCQEILGQFLIVLLHIIKRRTHYIFKIVAVAEKFDRLVHLAFQVTEAHHLSEAFLLVQHTVGTAERLQ